MSKHSPVIEVMPLYLVIFFGFVGYSLMITVFTPMLMHGQLPHKTIWLGVLLSAYPLGQFLGSPIIGAISDALGRKRVLLITLLIATVMYCCIALCVAYSALIPLIITAFVAGLFESNVALAMSSIADLAHGEQRVRLFGYTNISASFAYIIGPLFGGKLADPNIVSWFDHATPFWVVAICLLIMVFYCWIALTETRCKTHKISIEWSTAIKSVIHVFLPSHFRRVYLANFLMYLAVFGFLRCYPMYIVSQFHMNVAVESNYIAWVSVPFIVVNFGLISWLARRISSRMVCVWSSLLLAVSMIALVLPTEQAWLWLTLFMCGFFVALILPNSAAMISNIAHSNQQGSVMGNNMAVQVASESVSGFIGGLFAAITVQMSVIAMAIFALLALLVLVVIPEPNR